MEVEPARQTEDRILNIECRMRDKLGSRRVSVLTINDQPVENRRQKSARRGRGAPPQHGSQNAEDSRSSGLGVSRSSRESSIEAEIGLSEYQVVEIRAPGYQAVKVSIEYQASRKDQAIPRSA